MIVVQAIAISAAHQNAELAARPHAVVEAAATARTGSLTLGGVAVLVASTYRADRPPGVLVMLHGAGGKPDHVLALVEKHAALANLIIVAPKSEAESWDMMSGGFGPDVARIDGALTALFGSYAVDPARVTIGGFSDGASYALTLGLANGHLFGLILAFSPGYERAPRRQGAPKIYISHGIDDGALSIQSTSRRIVPALQQRGLDVEYYEFSGGHVVPPEALRDAMRLLGG